MENYFIIAKMNDTYLNLLGFSAAVLTTTAFVPQVVKVVKTKSTKDISLLMYLLFTAGVALWLIYGFAISSLPVIVANAITLLLSIVIIVYKLKGNSSR